MLSNGRVSVGLGYNAKVVKAAGKTRQPSPPPADIRIRAGRNLASTIQRTALSGHQHNAIELDNAGVLDNALRQLLDCDRPLLTFSGHYSYPCTFTHHDFLLSRLLVTSGACPGLSGQSKYRLHPTHWRRFMLRRATSGLPQRGQGLPRGWSLICPASATGLARCTMS